ncbi:TetR/AcrR family transcriptional regulator [Sphingobium sp.]|uniref:LmrA/YxaF family transcription factor n=1 Tax=Sphingobium sp. TaxID=1912891 RepID=UPI002C258B7C|nr:TetR/AcrR family transcriptional regulator [Sphingobium sp.]HUD93648.1 TetR/AcrR family transcriptional regulator [Sphingobium sp.]
MAAVLGEIDRWFIVAIFRPLEQAGEPSSAIIAMMAEVRVYFRSGARICLVGSVGLVPARDIFIRQIQGYFSRWVSALVHCLEAGNVPAFQAEALAEDAVSGIQGAIVLARAMRDEAVFERIASRHETALLGALLDASCERRDEDRANC